MDRVKLWPIAMATMGAAIFSVSSCLPFRLELGIEIIRVQWYIWINEKLRKWCSFQAGVVLPWMTLRSCFCCSELNPVFEQAINKSQRTLSAMTWPIPVLRAIELMSSIGYAGLAKTLQIGRVLIWAKNIWSFYQFAFEWVGSSSSFIIYVMTYLQK